MRYFEKSLRAIAIMFMFSIGVVIGAQQASACACCGTYRVVNVEHWDVLNVRSGPGVQFNIVASLKPDDSCISQTGERAGNWVRIDAHNASGWVNAYYLALIPG